MCKTKLQNKQNHGKNNGKKNVEKESVQQLSKKCPLCLNVKFIKEFKKKLRNLLAQRSNHIILLERVNALTFS